MKKGLLCIWVLCLLTQAGFVSAAVSEFLTISGTGDSQSLFQKVADDFNKANPGIRVVIPDSIGSGGGIRALLDGKVALARTARPLKEKEQGQGLVEFHFADSPVVFATHPSVEGVDDLTSEQIIGIFSGQYRRWSELGGADAKIYPIDREAGDSSHAALETNLPGFKDLHSRGKVFYTTPDTAHAIESHPFTIGYMLLSIALNSGLKVLRIDGRSPHEYVSSKSKYPFITPLYLLSKGEPKRPALQFLRFLSAGKTRRRLLVEGVRPVQ